MSECFFFYSVPMVQSNKSCIFKITTLTQLTLKCDYKSSTIIPIYLDCEVLVNKKQ